IITVVKQDEYADLPPTQIVPKLADQGMYIDSESTSYRVLREEKMQNHRGYSRAAIVRMKNERGGTFNFNDNPYSEAMFRTLKYRPDVPQKGFKSVEEARAWALKFIRWY